MLQNWRRDGLARFIHAMAMNDLSMFTLRIMVIISVRMEAGWRCVACICRTQIFREVERP